MIGANNKEVDKKDFLHLVLICDESGIFDAFRKIKKDLGERTDIFLTLIYIIPDNVIYPLFERELRILSKRFSTIFFVYKLKIESGDYGSIQESIEAIINSNINLKMHFSIFGNGEFVSFVSGILNYLNINTYSYSIDTEII
jgi:hypothetical protein